MQVNTAIMHVEHEEGVWFTRSQGGAGDVLPDSPLMFNMLYVPAYCLPFLFCSHKFLGIHSSCNHNSVAT